MTVAVVVLAPAAVIETASAWARLGLVGDSLWVATDGLTGIDLDTPNALTATHLRFEEEPVEGTLAVQLAELGSLDEARITWLRGTDASNVSLLRALDELARAILPYDHVHWLDIVVPQRRTDEATAPAAGVWTQFHIHPSDRPAPDVTDAGWDLGLPVPLHVTLALTGILGGTTTAVPWARLSAAQHWVVRVFSRLVDGGLEARREARRFVLEILPTSHAAAQHPSDYLPAEPAEASLIVEDAADWLLDSQNRALAYSPPATSHFSGHRRLSVGQHLAQFMRFLPIALRALFGIRSPPAVAVGRVFEFEDLGYNVGRPLRVAPRTESIPDFAAMELAAVNEASAAIEQLRTREGAQTSTEVWEPLAQVVTSLVDGGRARPEGWTEPTKHGRRQSLDPSWVSLSRRVTVTSTTTELASAENLFVAAEALSAARTNRDPALGPGADPDRVTATAVRLARRGNELDAEALASQLAGLDVPSSPEPGHRTLLDRIRGQVIGGVLRSRLDAERWSAAATRSPEGRVAAPVWGQHDRRFRRIWWIAIGLCVVLGIAWSVSFEDIRVALDLNISLGTGLAVIGILALAVALVILSTFFRTWNAFLERGRRRLELMALWLDRAARAWTAHAELRNVERTSRAWAQLLSDMLVTGETGQTGRDDIDIERMPFAMRVGHPRFQAQEMKEWLAQVGARPGWRLACINQLVGEFLDCPPDQSLQELAKDQALPGGLLDRLASRLPDIVTKWRRETESSIWYRLRAEITEKADRLDIPRRNGVQPSAGRIKSFLAELTPDDGEHPWSHEYLVPAGSMVPASNEPVLLMSAALSTARIRLQIEPLKSSDLLEPQVDDDPDANDDLPR